MCTQVITTARPDATRHRELSEQFMPGMDPASELSRLNSIVGSRQLTLPDLRQLISTPRVSCVLSTLAPAEFSRVRAHTAGGSRSALETTAADLQAELAETLAVAITSLSSLLKQPRELRTSMIDEFTRKEIDQLPGKAEAAVCQHSRAARQPPYQLPCRSSARQRSRACDDGTRGDQMSTSDHPVLGAPGQHEPLAEHIGAGHGGPLATATSQARPRSLGTESPGRDRSPATPPVRGAAPAGTQLADPAPKPVSPEWDATRAVEEIYNAHYRSLVRLAALLVRDVATAEEVVQDSFLAMHGAWRRVRDSDKTLSYLRQSVVNRSRSVLRHRVVVDRHAPKATPDMPSAEHGALSLLERSAVIAALRTLPPRQREALVLKYYADLSEAQIAAAMGISRGAVKSHTARGTASLRSILEIEM